MAESISNVVKKKAKAGNNIDPSTSVVKTSGAGFSKSPETVIRMNFLYQAATSLLSNRRGSSSSQAVEQRISTSYTHLLLGIGKKSQIRCHKEINRTICKGCHGLLKPGVTCQANIARKKNLKKKRLEIVCGRCQTAKSFLMKKELKEKNKSEKPSLSPVNSSPKSDAS